MSNTIKFQPLKYILVCVLSLFTVVSLSSQTTWYINDGTSVGDCIAGMGLGGQAGANGSFATPFNRLSSALAVAVSGDIIRVNTGLYSNVDNNITITQANLQIIGCGTNNSVWDWTNAGTQNSFFSIAATADNVRVSGISITRFNFNTGSAGQAVTILNGATGIVFDDVRFFNNGSSGGDAPVTLLGGASATSMTVTNSSGSCNSLNSGLYGGGIDVIGNNVSLSVINCVVQGNSRLQNNGGGLRVVGNATTVVNVINSHYNNNVAINGGAIFISDGALLNISNSCFTNNIADQASSTIYGGAIAVGRGSTVNVTNSRFNNNSCGSGAATGRGGAIGINTSFGTGAVAATVNVNNCSFTSNAAISDGRQIYARIGSSIPVNVSVTQSSFGGASTGSTIDITNGNTAGITVSNSGTFTTGGTVSVLNNTAATATNSPSCPTTFSTPCALICPGYAVQPTATISASTVTNCAAITSRTLSSTVTDCTGCTYQWQLNGSNIPTATTTTYNATVNGNYNLVISTTNGCTATSNILAVVANYTRMTVTAAGAPAAVCAGATFQMNSTLTGGSGPFSYTWTGPNSYISSDINPNRSFATTAMSGTYQISVTDQYNCSSTASVNVTVNAINVTVSTPNGSTACAGIGLPITASEINGVPIQSYNWSTGASTSTITALTSGQYNVTLTSTSGCTASFCQNITVSAVPVVGVTASSTTVSCAVPNVTLTASGGGTYAWSNGGAASSTVVNAGGTYIVTVTNAAGCTATGTITINQNTTAPTVTVSAPTVLNCTATVVTATASGASSYVWSNGQTTAAATFNSPGTFTVVGTNAANGCTASASTTVTQNITAPTVTVSAPAVLNCTTTVVTATASGASTYVWSNGQTTAAATFNAPGTFTVIGTNSANGCTTSASTTVTQNITAPTVTVSAPSVLNCTATVVTATASGASSYVWSNGQTTAAATFNAPGTFTVVGTNSANGCTASASTTVTQNIIAPTVTVSVPAVLNCTTTVVTATASGASSYVWSNGQTTAAATFNAPGTFTVVGTNPANGCTASASTTVTQNIAAPSAFVNTSSAILTCSNTSITITAGSLVASPSFNWGGGNTNAALVVNSPGDYIVTVTDNANGCTASASTTVTQNIIAPTVTVSVPAVLNCTTTVVTATASGASSYVWSNGQTTAAATFNAPGTFTVVGTNSANGCTASASTNVTQNITAPTVTVSAPAVLNCTATVVTATASGASSYVWSNSQTTAAATFNSPGTFTVVGTNAANGCTASASTTVTQNITAPTVTVSAPAMLNCTTTVVTATASGASSYVWSNGQTAAAATFNAPGTFTVVGTNAANGCTASVSTTVTQNITAPTVTVAAASVLNCTTTVVTATASGASSYVWSNGQTSAAATFNAPGTFTVVGTDSANGCTASASTTVTQNITAPSAFVNASSAILTCSNASITITAGSLVANPSFNWGGGNTNAALVVNSPGNYIVTVTDNANGCTATASRNITQNITAPTVTVSSPAVLNCTMTVVSSTASGASTYVWSDGQTTAAATFNALGTFTVVGTNSANGCTASASTTVTQDIAAPTVTVSAPAVLNCTTTVVTATASGASSYVWSNGQTTAAATFNSPGTFTVVGTNSANGCTALASTTVTQNITAPTVTVSSPAVLNCTTTVVTATASGASSYVWSNGQTTAAATFNVPGTFTVVGTNAANGCTASASTTVTQNNTAPTVTVSSPAVLNCTATVVTATASGASSYVWSNGQTTAAATFNAPGTFTVVGTNAANGCTASATTTVTQNITVPTVTVSSPAVLNCTATVVTATVSGASAYVWSNGQTTAAATFNAPGTFTVVGTDATNGCTVSASTTVTQDIAAPSAFVNASSAILTCSNTSITITAGSLVANPSFNWGGGNTNAALVVNSPGNYIVTVTDNSNGCTSTASRLISQDTTTPTTVITPNATSVTCANPSVNLTASGGGTYLWDNAAGSNASISVSPTVNTTYNVTVTAANGCTASASASVAVFKDIPTVTCTSTSPVCKGESVQFQAALGFASYAWTGPLGYTATGVYPDRDDVIVGHSGTYTVNATDQYGCVGTANTNVTVNTCAEICGNGVDDDGDGAIDTDDSDCPCGN